MKTTTEAIAESVKTFTEMQKEMINGMFTENPFKIENPFSKISNSTEIMENTVKFHNACIQYHTSVLSMLEAMNALNPIKKTNK
jgi:hypothetical protein